MRGDDGATEEEDARAIGGRLLPEVPDSALQVSRLRQEPTRTHSSDRLLTCW